MNTNKTLPLSVDRANVRAALSVFNRAAERVNALGAAIEAAGGGDNGDATPEARILLALYVRAEARLFTAAAQLDRARRAARPQLALAGAA